MNAGHSVWSLRSDDYRMEIHADTGAGDGAMVSLLYPDVLAYFEAVAANVAIDADIGDHVFFQIVHSHPENLKCLRGKERAEHRSMVTVQPLQRVFFHGDRRWPQLVRFGSTIELDMRAVADPQSIVHVLCWAESSTDFVLDLTAAVIAKVERVSKTMYLDHIAPVFGVDAPGPPPLSAYHSIARYLHSAGDAEVTILDLRRSVPECNETVLEVLAAAGVISMYDTSFGDVAWRLLENKMAPGTTMVLNMGDPMHFTRKPLSINDLCSHHSIWYWMLLCHFVFQCSLFLCYLV